MSEGPWREQRNANMHGLDKIKVLTGKIDKAALSAAVGVMLLSWGALPIVYWLIIRKREDKKDKEEK